MPRIQDHFRRTFLAGIFAAVPVAVTIFIAVVVEQRTRVITQYLFGRAIPVVGILIALAGIYVAGVIATSLLGRFVLGIIDWMLIRIPGLRQLYVAWKQIALTPGGTEGTFSRVVLIPDETNATHLLGFCNGRPIGEDKSIYCVFVPSSPNPIQGRLYFVRCERCMFVDVSSEEAFKVVLSTGNYVPSEIGAAASKLLSRPA